MFDLVMRKIDTASASILRAYRRLIFPFNRQVEFIQYFNTWIEEGASEREACDAMLQANDQDSPEYKAALSIRNEVVSGKPMGAGMSSWFSPLIVTLFESASANQSSLTEGLKDFTAIEALKKSLIKDFMSPLKHPLMLVVLLLPAIAFVGVYLGKQENSRNQLELTIPMEIVKSISIILLDFLPIVLVVVCFLVFLGKWWLETSQSKLRLNFLDHKFPVNIYRELQALRVMNQMGILIRVGQLTPRQAALVMQPHVNPYISYHLGVIIQTSHKGQQDLVKLLNTGLLNQLSMMRLALITKSATGYVQQSAVSKVAFLLKEDFQNYIKKIKRYAVLAAWGLLLGLLLLLTSTAVDVLMNSFNGGIL